MKVSELMAQPVLKIDENSTIFAVTELMSQKHVGSLIVTRRGWDIGIITEKEIISKVNERKGNLKEIKVKEITSTPFVTVDKNTTCEDAIRIMAEREVRRLAVTDYGDIIGIFSTADVTKLVGPDTKSEINQ